MPFTIAGMSFIANKFSVALPVVKHRFFGEALDSVLAQTYPGFELIILNNAVAGDEKRMIRETVDQHDDPRIRYMENEVQLPIIANWNKCLSFAKNELFVLFSDDDLYHPEFLCRMAGLADRYPGSHVFHCRVCQVNESGDVTGYAPVCPAHESQLDFIWHAMKGVRLQFAPDFVSRTVSLKAIGGFIDFPLAWVSDYVTWFTLAGQGGVAYTPETLVSFRVSGISLSSAGNVEQRMEATRMYREWIGKFIRDYKPSDSEEADLVNEIRRIYPGLFLHKSLFLLSQAIRGRYNASALHHILRLKKKYNIPTLPFLKTLATAITRGA